MRVEIYTDGGARGNPGPGAGGIRLVFNDQDLRFGVYFGHVTNNQAEYLAVIAAFRFLAAEIELTTVESCTVMMDSELVVKQAKGEYAVKDANLKVLLRDLRKVTVDLPMIEWKYIPRAENEIADRLVNVVLDINHGTTPTT